jgi:hypothetical protein
MRAFNLFLFMLVVIAVIIVVWIGVGNGGVALGGYPGPAHPQQIQMSPISLP